MSNLPIETQRVFVEKVAEYFKDGEVELGQAMRKLYTAAVDLAAALEKHGDLAGIRETYLGLLWKTREAAVICERMLKNWVDYIMPFLRDSSVAIDDKKKTLLEQLVLIKAQTSQCQGTLQSLQNLQNDLRAQILQRGDVARLEEINDDLKTEHSKLLVDPWVAYPGEIGLVCNALLQAGPYFTHFVERSLYRGANSLPEGNWPPMPTLFPIVVLHDKKANLLEEAGADNIAAAMAGGLDAIDGLIFICGVGNLLQSIVRAMVNDMNAGELPVRMDQGEHIINGVKLVLREFHISFVSPHSR